MTALSLIAKPGATLRWGVPLGGGLLVLMAAGIGSMFVPITSAWYPLLHNIYMYGGLALFTAYVAYDTQKMIDEYELGQDDHLKHAVDLFIDFKVTLTHSPHALPSRTSNPLTHFKSPRALQNRRSASQL